MKDYYQIREVSDVEILNACIKDGWEIIDSYSTGGDLRYHVGLTKDTVIENLRKVISMYEEHGMKDMLLKKVGESLGDDINDYEETTFQPSLNPLAQMVKFYEQWVNEEDVMLKRKPGKERDSDEVDYSLPF